VKGVDVSVELVKTNVGLGNFMVTAKPASVIARSVENKIVLMVSYYQRLQ
jgi:hypothetical protein